LKKRRQVPVSTRQSPEEKHKQQKGRKRREKRKKKGVRIAGGGGKGQGVGGFTVIKPMEKGKRRKKGDVLKGWGNKPPHLRFGRCIEKGRGKKNLLRGRGGEQYGLQTSERKVNSKGMSLAPEGYRGTGRTKESWKRERKKYDVLGKKERQKSRSTLRLAQKRFGRGS